MALIEKNIDTILWDFDGVILDSMEVRDIGFKEIFKSFSNFDVDRLIDYHRKNGGLSRYVKIRYFFNKILKLDIDENKIKYYANQFSIIMKKKLIDEKKIINISLEFIKKNHKRYNFHIVSGSDDIELNYLCNNLKIDKYFISVHGSPTPKKILVENLLKKHQYTRENTFLIGDSINDYEAAIYNNIRFCGFNNDNLNNLDLYTNDFSIFNKYER